MMFHIGDEVVLELMPPGVTGRIVEIDGYDARIEWSDTDVFDDQWWYLKELRKVEE